MNLKELAVLAIKEEAKQKPLEKIIIGSKVITYSEVVSKLENGDTDIQELLVKPFLHCLKENKSLRDSLTFKFGTR